jgi:hypothetical protein
MSAHLSVEFAVEQERRQPVALLPLQSESSRREAELRLYIRGQALAIARALDYLSDGLPHKAHDLLKEWL